MRARFDRGPLVGCEADGGDHIGCGDPHLPIRAAKHRGLHPVLALETLRRQAEPPFDADAQLGRTSVGALRSERSHGVDARVAAVVGQLSRAVHDVPHTGQTDELSHHHGVEFRRRRAAATHEVHGAHAPDEAPVSGVVDVGAVQTRGIARDEPRDVHRHVAVPDHDDALAQRIGHGLVRVSVEKAGDGPGPAHTREVRAGNRQPRIAVHAGRKHDDIVRPFEFLDATSTPSRQLPRNRTPSSMKSRSNWRATAFVP